MSSNLRERELKGCQKLKDALAIVDRVLLQNPTYAHVVRPIGKEGGRFEQVILEKLPYWTLEGTRVFSDPKTEPRIQAFLGAYNYLSIASSALNDGKPIQLHYTAQQRSRLMSAGARLIAEDYFQKSRINKDPIKRGVGALKGHIFLRVSELYEHLANKPETPLTQKQCNSAYNLLNRWLVTTGRQPMPTHSSTQPQPAQAPSISKQPPVAKGRGLIQVVRSWLNRGRSNPSI